MADLWRARVISGITVSSGWLAAFDHKFDHSLAIQGVSPVKYAGYEIARVVIVDFGNGAETIKITDPDQLSELDEDVIDTFFTLFGCYRDGKSLLTDELCDSADFDRVLQVYSRITGNEARLSPPTGYLIQLPA